MGFWKNWTRFAKRKNLIVIYAHTILQLRFPEDLLHPQCLIMFDRGSLSERYTQISRWIEYCGFTWWQIISFQFFDTWRSTTLRGINAIVSEMNLLGLLLYITCWANDLFEYITYVVNFFLQLLRNYWGCL